MKGNKMGYKNFRIEFQTSQITNLSASVIREKIFAKLNDKKYVVEDDENNTITFGRELFELVWSFEAPYILDGGCFEIIESEKGIIVVLNYFLKTLYFLLMVIIFMILLISNQLYTGIFFFTTFFLCIGIYQFFTTKNVGEKLLRDILTDK